jgi:2',3'-cyclic-nucleotide 2'-phosphodiesterase (5'-nucleotidase family)
MLQKRMFRNAAAFSCFFILFSCQKPAATPGHKELTLIHYNDVYEFGPTNGGKRGGVARLQTILNEHASENPMLVFGGDALGGSQISVAEKGKPAITIFNALGVDYAVIGNHEFDFGLKNAGERLKESKSVWLASNLKDTVTGKPVAEAQESALVEWNGVKVGIIGLIDDWIGHTQLGKSVRYEDFVVRGSELAKKLKQDGAEVIVALTHMYVRDDRKLAREVPEIDVILGGHDHEVMSENVNGTPIVKVGSDFYNAGLIKIDVEKNHDAHVTTKLIPIDDHVPFDSDMEKLVTSLSGEMLKAMKDVVVETEVEWDLRDEIVRREESAIGDLFTDAIRIATKADIALINGGGLRSNQVYSAGTISKKNLRDILPFENKIITISLIGKDLRAVLENSVSYYESTAGRFPQISGFSFSFAPSHPVGSRVQEMRINGQVLDETKLYSVAIPDYIGAGGDGYDLLKTAKRLQDEKSGKLFADIVEAYLKSKGLVSPSTDGRIIILKQ